MATRVVLVKPGDVLIFGNVGDIDDVVAETIGETVRSLKESLNLDHVVVFSEDIDLAAVPGNGASA